MGRDGEGKDMSAMRRQNVGKTYGKGVRWGNDRARRLIAEW